MIRAALVAALLLGPAGLAAAQDAPSPANNEGRGGIANPAPATNAPATPSAGAPERQAPVPETGAGRGAQTPAGTGNALVPESTAREAPTPSQQPAAPIPERAPQPAPLAVQPAPPPMTARGGPNAAELELQAALRGERIQGRITIPDAQAANLVQPEGRDWRWFRNNTQLWVGGVAVLGMLAALLLFYLVRGRIRVEGGFSGRTLLRFNWFERGVHWMVSGSFIVLALSGLNLSFGRALLRPIIGPEAFTAVTHWGKMAHNFLGLPFTVGIVLMFLLWVRDNIPNRLDLVWLRQFGGFVGGKHPPAARFNAGQKGVFWMTVAGGGVVAASGYWLLFPFAVSDIQGMQWSHMVHALLSMLMIAGIMAHIYIGSIGMEGGIDAMSNGRVDYNWAREHHSLWVEEELDKARASVRPDTGGARALGAD